MKRARQLLSYSFIHRRTNGQLRWFSANAARPQDGTPSTYKHCHPSKSIAIHGNPDYADDCGRGLSMRGS
jgi:hypothetical protein